MKRAFQATAIVFIILAAIVVYCAAATVYNATDDENSELQLSSLDIQRAAIVWQEAAKKLPEYAAYQKQVADGDKLIDAIKKAHNWPATVQLNRAIGQWVDTAPAKQPEKK